MAKTTLRRLLVVVLCWGLAVGCGRESAGLSSLPTSPTTTVPAPTAASSCRTYASAFTMTQAGGPIIGGDGNRFWTPIVVTQSCRFDTTTNELTCTLSDDSASPTIVVTSYRSRADFIGETRVIPPVATWTRSASTSAGSTVTSTLDFDSQGRVIRLNFLVAGGTSGSTSYTAWDSSGRPTQSVASNGQTFQYIHDENARVTTGLEISGSSRRCERAYDRQGNRTTYSCTDGLSQTFNTTGTETICS